FALAPGGKMMASYGALASEGELALWRVPEMKRLRVLPWPKEHQASPPELDHLGFSPDGRFLVATAGGVRLIGPTYHVLLWDLKQGTARQVQFQLQDHIAQLVTQPVFGMRSQSLVYQVSTNRLAVWDLHRGARRQVIHLSGQTISGTPALDRE